MHKIILNLDANYYGAETYNLDANRYDAKLKVIENEIKLLEV